MMKAKPVKSMAPKTAKGIDDVNPSVGDHRAKDYPAVKTSGVQTRGNGAAQRGKTARGPMA